MKLPDHTREAARLLRSLYRTDVRAFEREARKIAPAQLEQIVSCWQFIARPAQLRPPDCRPIWVRQCGRGEGKTRSAAEETLDICEDWGERARVILCSKTYADVRNVMIDGVSGLSICARRRGYKIRYIKNERRIYHPSGAVLEIATTENPEGPRGMECNYFWADEVAAWMHAIQTLDNIMFAWRHPCPEQPKAIITTTPRPNPIMLRLVRDAATAQSTTITRGRTLDNAVNLAPEAVRIMMHLYHGTRLGRQELDGELLEGQGTIVQQDTIHKFRTRSTPDLARRIVSLDPSIDDKETSDAAGIVVLGADGPVSANPDVYVLDDRTIEQASFSKWARAAVIAFIEWDCDCIVAEINQGGGGIVEAIQYAAEALGRQLRREIVVPVRSVWARQSKKARAEPVGALYERGRVHHVGHFEALEKELTTWMPGDFSPNRMDALVHGAVHLTAGDEEKVGDISAYF